MVPLFVLLTIITLLTIDYFVQRAERRKVQAANALLARMPETTAPRAAPVPRPTPPLDEIPAGVFLDPAHVWVQLEPSGALRVGADRMPLAALGRPDRIQMVAEGTAVRKGDPLATLFRGRRSVVLRSPVDGVVTRVNSDARSDPDRLRDDPFGQGWLYWLDPRDLAPALKRMRVAEEARAFARRQLQDLRDFMLASTPGDRLVGATLQDGGAPVEGLSEHLDDESWNLLVEQFFPSRA